MGEQVSLKTLKTLVRKMRLENRSVLLIKAGSALDDPDVLNQLSHVIAGTNLKDIVIVTTGDFEDVKSLPEEMMNKVGWYRVESLRSKVLRAAKKEDVPTEQQESGA